MIASISIALKMEDFYENLNALEYFKKHFQKAFSFLDQPIINFYDRIIARIVLKC